MIDRVAPDLACRLLMSLGVMTDARATLGKLGEDLACLELERRGYEILERRYRRRGGEIDIIARDGATLVFVEVKAREGDDFGDGADAVTARKRRHMTAIALDYMARAGSVERPCRFDVVSIRFDRRPPAIELFRNAFDAC